ncbi:hypothetical protein [Moheibacter stercoris]|uniref:Uncharacterized protein n=1 Tax=Moheibacter stercoris TaxID=1628251 RepID=A0ABV2LSS3_9FLAO
MLNKSKLFFIFLLISRVVFAQELQNIKVDSIYDHYLTIVKIAAHKIDVREYPELYEVEYVDALNDSVYINKFQGEAIDFFENITSIFTSKKHIGISMIRVVDETIINKWIAWFEENKHKLFFCDKHKSIHKIE